MTVHFATADYCGTGVPYRANGYYQSVDTTLRFRERTTRAIRDRPGLRRPDTGPGRDQESFSAQLSIQSAQ